MLANRWGAVVGGSITTLGGHCVVGLQAINCETPELIGNAQAEAQDREKVLHALGDATARLRSWRPFRGRGRSCTRPNTLMPS
jgi:hypothetical protein